MAIFHLKLLCYARTKKNNPDLQRSPERISFDFSTPTQTKPAGEGINKSSTISLICSKKASWKIYFVELNPTIGDGLDSPVLFRTYEKPSVAGGRGVCEPISQKGRFRIRWYAFMSTSRNSLNPECRTKIPNVRSFAGWNYYSWLSVYHRWSRSSRILIENKRPKTEWVRSKRDLLKIYVGTKKLHSDCQEEKNECEFFRVALRCGDRTRKDRPCYLYVEPSVISLPHHWWHERNWLTRASANQGRSFGKLN